MSYTMLYTCHLEGIRIPQRLDTSPGTGWVMSLRLKPDSMHMDESIVILSFVDELVDEITKL